MERRLKERLIGAVVLVLVAVIFIPMILDDTIQGENGITGSNIPVRPESEFSGQAYPASGTEIELPPPRPLDGEPTATEKPQAEVSRPGIPAEEQALDQVPVVKTPEAVDKPEAAKASAWVVQLGSFSSKDNAYALNERLRGAGFPAFVEPLERESGTIYRVRVGPEILRSDAQLLQEKLKKFIKMDGIVIKYP